MKFTRRNIQRINRNGEANNFSYSTSTSKAVGGNSSKGSYLPAIYNGDGSYVVDVTKVLFKGNITAEGEMTAHKQGTDGEISGGQIVVYDGLDSTDSTIALSANQGRILKGLIDNKADGGGNNTDLFYTKEQTDKKIADLVNGAPETMDTLKELSDALATNKDAVDVLDKAITNKADKNHKHTKADITDLDLTKYDNHLLDTTKHITSTERTNWDDANSKKHTHSNKAVLDGITSSSITSWNNKLDKSIWDKAFYFDGSNNIRVKVNLIGDKEVSAYGKGDTSSGGAVTIVDSLNSTLTDAALSANQGRVLKNLIDSKGSNMNPKDYYTITQSNEKFQPKGNYLTSIPSGYATTNWVSANYQPKGNYLTSHQQLKTINNQSIVGSGNITIEGGKADGNYYISKIEGDGNSTVTYYRNGFTPITHNMKHTHSEYLTENQMATINHTYLTRGGNIQLKTINGESVMGSGDISVSGGNMSDYYTKIDCNTNFYDRRKGLILNTQTITYSEQIKDNTDFVIMRNNSWIDIKLPSSAPAGKVIFFKQLTGAGGKFSGGIYAPTDNNPNWNYQMKKYAHNFYLICLGGNQWMISAGW